MYPANADSPFENRHFLTHRPPIISPCSPLTMRTCSPLTMRRPPPIGSPHRGILCVEKIGSAAPELQEWPGTPSKPVKSTNGPFYWLTRKRAPPWWGTPVKTVSRPGSEVGLVLLPGDTFTSFTSHIHTHRKSSYRPKDISFGKKHVIKCWRKYCKLCNILILDGSRRAQILWI